MEEEETEGEEEDTEDDDTFGVGGVGGRDDGCPCFLP